MRKYGKKVKRRMKIEVTVCDHNGNKYRPIS